MKLQPRSLPVISSFALVTGLCRFSSKSFSNVLGTSLLFLMVTWILSFKASAQNLVQNGGFETGNFSNWTLEGSLADTFVSFTFSHSGNYGAGFGSTQPQPDYISQSLATTSGQSYKLSFWYLSGDDSGGTPTRFIVQWGNNTIFDQSDLVMPVWTNMQFLVTATTNSTVLKFGGYNRPDYTQLDDISVTPPAPGPQTNSTPVLPSISNQTV